MNHEDNGELYVLLQPDCDASAVLHVRMDESQSVLLLSTKLSQFPGKNVLLLARHVFFFKFLEYHRKFFLGGRSALARSSADISALFLVVKDAVCRNPGLCSPHGEDVEKRRSLCMSRVQDRAQGSSSTALRFPVPCERLRVGCVSGLRRGCVGGLGRQQRGLAAVSVEPAGSCVSAAPSCRAEVHLWQMSKESLPHSPPPPPPLLPLSLPGMSSSFVSEH